MMFAVLLGATWVALAMGVAKKLSTISAVLPCAARIWFAEAMTLPSAAKALTVTVHATSSGFTKAMPVHPALSILGSQAWGWLQRWRGWRGRLVLRCCCWVGIAQCTHAIPVWRFLGMILITSLFIALFDHLDGLVDFKQVRARSHRPS